MKGQTLPFIKNYFDIDIRYRYFKLGVGKKLNFFLQRI